ncbi:DUF1835 domain-containing protein [Paenibacillus sp. UNC451MF]|uniref:DUF1835 domain-containing protein n=1 Tax=Paenibacillus sp. UNC451MF TaxID=1449063 RepID=UPI00048FBA55|nr:DUF1835 domain-containing protein [Paenibacillus sp. UNC451MF]
MLHIVNGDSFGSTLRKSGIEGDILVWRESLYEGPLSALFTDEETRKARLEYFSARGVPSESFQSQTDFQEAALRQSSRYKEIVLWFEYDLFDQTMLIYLLQWFYKHGYVMNETNLQLVCIDSFQGVHPFKGLGQLTPKQTLELKGTWKPVSNEQLMLANTAWCAYASTNPQAILDLLEQDTSALPFLNRSMKCHLERFPSLTNGLSYIEQLTLEGLREGLNRLPLLFHHISEAVPDYGIGDSQYWGCLKDLYSVPDPLIAVTGPELPGYTSEGPVDFNQWLVELTPFGERVLSGSADCVARNGVNRWVGGCHLGGKLAVWRWDRSSQQLVQK